MLWRLFTIRETGRKEKSINALFLQSLHFDMLNVPNVFLHIGNYPLDPLFFFHFSYFFVRRQKQSPPSTSTPRNRWPKNEHQSIKPSPRNLPRLMYRWLTSASFCFWTFFRTRMGIIIIFYFFAKVRTESFFVKGSETLHPRLHMTTRSDLQRIKLALAEKLVFKALRTLKARATDWKRKRKNGNITSKANLWISYRFYWYEEIQESL